MSNVTPIPDHKTIEAEAAAWIAQLDGGTPSQEDLAALREWMNRSPVHRAAMERLSVLWDDVNILTQLGVPLPGRSRQRHGNLLRRLQPGIALSLGAACALVLVVAAGIWQWRDGTAGRPGIAEAGNAPVASSSRVSYTTAIGQQQTVNLDDGSRITLNTDSEVSVSIEATGRTIRLIRGEALFEVAHDPVRPFLVYAGTGLVRAVGTAFSVYLKERGNVSVTVTEGEVELAVQDADATAPASGAGPAAAIPLVTIRAGQSATFGRAIESIESLAQAEIERQLSWREGMLRFQGEPLSRVVLEVSRYTTQKIVILDPALRDLRIGGYFKVGETEAMFEALQSSFGVRVERINENLVHLSAAP